MKELLVVPQIDSYKTFGEFAAEAKIGAGDLILTNEYIYNPLMKAENLSCRYIFQEKYGAGEPTDQMVDAILAEMNQEECLRIFAVGGGTILDIGKILALKDAENVDVLYERTELEKGKKLYLIPTTCGTGSEMTNIAIVNRTRKGTKMGLTSPAMYADHAVLIPEFLGTLPYYVFATSSIDALIHGMEAYLSPNSTSYTDMYGAAAMEMILAGYCRIAKEGPDARFAESEAYLRASNYAGIAFGNAGCAAVHAMSYALGAKYHVPHGESNYQFLISVLRKYQEKKPEGKLKSLNDLLLQVLKQDGAGDGADGIEALERLLAVILKPKAMKEYGAVQEDIPEFAASTIANQQRLLRNNYVELSQEEIQELYQKRLNG